MNKNHSFPACHSRAAGAWSTSTSISLLRFPSKDLWPFWPPQPTSLWWSCVCSRPAQSRHPAQQAPPQAPQAPVWGGGLCRLGRRRLKRQCRRCRCRPGTHHPREETHLDHFLLSVLRSFDKEKGTPQYLQNALKNGNFNFTPNNAPKKKDKKRMGSWIGSKYILFFPILSTFLLPFNFHLAPYPGHSSGARKCGLALEKRPHCRPSPISDSGASKELR